MTAPGNNLSKSCRAAVALAQANLDEAQFLLSETSKHMIEAQNRLSEIRNRESRLTRGLQGLQEQYSKLNLRIFRRP